MDESKHGRGAADGSVSVSNCCISLGCMLRCTAREAWALLEFFLQLNFVLCDALGNLAVGRQWCKCKEGYRTKKSMTLETMQSPSTLQSRRCTRQIHLSVTDFRRRHGSPSRLKLTIDGRNAEVEVPGAGIEERLSPASLAINQFALRIRLDSCFLRRLIWVRIHFVSRSSGSSIPRKTHCGWAYRFQP